MILNKADQAIGSIEARARSLAHELRSDSFPLVLADGSDPDGRDWTAFTSALTSRVFADCAGEDPPAATRARHGRLLRQAGEHLRRALAAADRPELAAEDVRLAGRALARVTGEIGVEDILGEVFGRFCIGK